MLRRMRRASLYSLPSVPVLQTLWSLGGAAGAAAVGVPAHARRRRELAMPPSDDLLDELIAGVESALVAAPMPIEPTKRSSKASKWWSIRFAAPDVCSDCRPDARAEFQVGHGRRAMVATLARSRQSSGKT
jgi:hypothetical protein